MKSKYMKRIMLLATAVLTMSSCDSFWIRLPRICALRNRFMRLTRLHRTQCLEYILIFVALIL